jgi:RNA polymerase sigma-70 factor (ECF subfamily)
MRLPEATLPDASTDGDLAFTPSFEAFYRREFPVLVDLAYATSGSRLAAEDLVQEAMIAASRNWQRISRLDRPGAWVRRVVLNLSTSLYRRRLAEVRALARLAWLRGEPPALLDAESTDFWKALRCLPKRQVQAVALHYLDGYSIKEMAEVMGCAENTVKVHLHRARRALSAELGLEENCDV